MNWIYLEDIKELDHIKKESEEHPVLIFKHSIRCAISSMVINRLERSWKQEETMGIKPYYLDLIRYRDISNRIEEEFSIPHQSPQVIVIKNGKPIYDNSHMGINYDDLKALVKS